MSDYLIDSQQIKLGDILDVKHGYAFEGKYITSIPQKNILVTPGNFNIGGGFKSFKLKYFSGEVPSNYVLSEGDIIITMTDLSKDGDTLGYSAKVPKSISGEKYLHNQRVGLLKFHSEAVDKNFIYWLTRTYDYHWYVVSAASGTSIRHTSPRSIKNYQFSLPSLAKQKNISEILDCLEHKIDLLHRQNNTLQNLAQAIFKEKFIVHRKDEWKSHSVGDVVSIRGGTTPSTSESKYWNGQHHWTSPRDLSNSSSPFLTTTEKTITDVGLKQIGSGLLPIGTVLLSSRAPIGYLAISDLPVAINQGYIAIVCDKVVSKYFMYFWLKSNMNTIISAANGSTFLEISKSTFKSLDFVLPESSCLIDFDKQVYPLFERVRKNVYEINTLKKLRYKLLPKLMSGSISV